MAQRYRFSYLIHISHSMTNASERHMHTLQIDALIRSPESRQTVPFGELEKTVGTCLGRFDGACLNDIPLFDGNTTIENVGEVLCRLLEEELTGTGWELYRFEIGETPLRVYIIAEDPAGRNI